MKKLLSLVCTLAIVIGCAGTAFASTESGSRDYTVSDMNTNLYEGEWREVAAGLQILIPTVFTQVTVTTSEGDICTTYSTPDGAHTFVVHEMTAAAFGYDSLSAARAAYLEGGRDSGERESASGKNSMIAKRSIVTDTLAGYHETLADIDFDVVNLNVNDNAAFSVLLGNGDYLVVTQSGDKFVTIKFVAFSSSDEEYRAWVQNMVISLSAPTIEATANADVAAAEADADTNVVVGSSSAAASTGEANYIPVIAIVLLSAGAILLIANRIAVRKESADK